MHLIAQQHVVFVGLACNAPVGGDIDKDPLVLGQRICDGAFRERLPDHLVNAGRALSAKGAAQQQGAANQGGEGDRQCEAAHAVTPDDANQQCQQHGNHQPAGGIAAEMVVEQTGEPETGAQHHQAEQDAQMIHPAPRFRQPEGEPWQGRHQQPGQAHTNPQSCEDEPELAERRRQRKGHCSAEKGGRAGGRQQSGEAPLQEVTAEAVAAAGGKAGAEGAGQADLEQPQQVGAKQQGDQHHQADKTGALELDAPADGPLRGAQQAAHGRQHPEGGDDPGAGGEELLAYRSLFTLLMLQHSSQLERQHRQHAGHQVEDQAAEQRCSQQPEQRMTLVGQCEWRADRPPALPRLFATGEQQAEGLATQIRRIPLPAIAHRHPGDQGVAFDLKRRFAKLGTLQSVDKERW